MDFMYRWALWTAVAIIALVALANIVWGQEGGHADFHDFYVGQQSPTGGSCCFNDCQPVLEEWRDGVLYLGLFRDGAGQWVEAPDDRMMAVPAPDWQYHACWPFGQSDRPYVRCWWAPGLS